METTNNMTMPTGIMPTTTMTTTTGIMPTNTIMTPIIGPGTYFSTDDWAAPMIEEGIKKAWEGESNASGISLKEMRRILKAAETNEGLKDLIEQMRTYFRLIDSPEDEVEILMRPVYVTVNQGYVQGMTVMTAGSGYVAPGVANGGVNGI